MKLIAKADIIYGARTIKAGETVEVDKKTASKFLKLKWVEKEPNREPDPEQGGIDNGITG